MSTTTIKNKLTLCQDNKHTFQHIGKNFDKVTSYCISCQFVRDDLLDLSNEDGW